MLGHDAERLASYPLTHIWVSVLRADIGQKGTKWKVEKPLYPGVLKGMEESGAIDQRVMVGVGTEVLTVCLTG